MRQLRVDYFGSLFGSPMCWDLSLVVQAAMPSAYGGAASAISISTWLCPLGFQSLNAATLVALLVFFIAAISGMDVWTGRSLLVSGLEKAFLFGFRLSTSLLMVGEGHIEKAMER